MKPRKIKKYDIKKRPKFMSPFFTNGEEFIADLNKRGPSPEHYDACWSCGRANEPLVIADMGKMLGRKKSEFELWLCCWCYPTMQNSYLAFVGEVHNRKVPKKALWPVPIDSPECPCCHNEKHHPELAKNEKNSIRH